MAGCPNDCVASIARADMSIIGTWRDEIQVDADAVREYAANGDFDILADVAERCPTKCMSWDGEVLNIDDANCVKCMHCINVMPKALAPGKDRGATILVGSKAPIIGGALLSSVMVPFLKMEEPYEDLKELVDAMWELWSEHGKNRERIGEFIQRIGLGNFLEQIGLDPAPEMVIQPRTNPYIFYELDDEYEDEEDY
jgi:sulfite reductase alpha subunit